MTETAVENNYKLRSKQLRKNYITDLKGVYIIIRRGKKKKGNRIRVDK